MNKIFFFFLFLLLISFGFAINDVCTYAPDDTNSDCLDANFSYDNYNGEIPLYFFFSEGCDHCHNVSIELDQLKEKYSLGIVSIDVKNEPELFRDIADDFDKGYGIPKIVINGKLLSGENEIGDNLEKEIIECKKTGKCKLYNPKENETKIGFGIITGLALADAINPCALAVLLILLSSVLLKFSRKHVLKYGLAFIVAIYLSYLSMGLILILGFKSLNSYLAIGNQIFTIVFGVIAIILGLLNLKDYLAYGSGGFVIEVPKSWRPKMKKILKDVTSIWSALIIAFIVSFFLLPCTAGPYFLVSGLLYNQGWLSVILWLIYYNLIFVLPMIIITILIYFGAAQVEKLEEKRAMLTKIIHLFASIILIVLGIWLLLYL